MITRQQAETLRHGQSIYFLNEKKDGTARVISCRVFGQVKTWKSRPDDWYVPVKYGMYEHAYIGRAGNADGRDFVNGKSLEDPARFYLDPKELDDHLPPVVKGRMGTKAQVNALNALLEVTNG